MARPAKQPSEHRKPRSVRYTDAEWDHLAEQALRAGVSVSDYVRSASLDYRLALPYGPRPADPALVSEINRLALAMDRVGNNVNQIAASAHVDKLLPGLSAAAAEELASERKHVRDALEGLLEGNYAD